MLREQPTHKVPYSITGREQEWISSANRLPKAAALADTQFGPLYSLLL